jgi:hypothetical protein
MDASDATRFQARASLSLPLGHVEIGSESQLHKALQSLASFQDGQEAVLCFKPQHYIKATRKGEFWSVVMRRGAWWTMKQFTAGMTTDYTDRETRIRREAGSFWKRLFFVANVRPEDALSIGQVESLFVSFLTGARFSVPVSGAGGL